MTKPSRACAAVALALGLSGSAGSAQANAPGPANPQILAYHSEITVNPNATLQVQETITFLLPGGQAQPAIYRDFPSINRDRFGDISAVHLRVDSVERDGEPQEFSLAKLPEGLRVYLDKGSKPLSADQHIYTIAYTLDRALALYAEHDELFWNVTGTGWPFPIQEASATVHLPKGIAQYAIILDAYTGAQASVRTDYIASADKQSNARFRTTRPLGPQESLSIVVRWPKGFTRPPTEDEKYSYFLEDNLDLLTALAGFGLVLVFYTVVWFTAGRREQPDLRAARGAPPRGLSPAGLRYAWRRAFDEKTLAVNLVGLAVKKHLALLEDSTGAYILGRLNADLATADRPPESGGTAWEGLAEVTPDERLVLRKIFSTSRTIRLVETNHALLGSALEALHGRLRFQTERDWVSRNGRYLAIGLGLSLLVVLRCGFSVPGADRLTTGILTPLLLVVGFAALLVGVAAILTWKDTFLDPLHRRAGIKQALRLSGFFLPLCLAELGGLEMLARATSAMTVLLVLTLIALALGFHAFLKVSRHFGRALEDDIEEFRRFLAEADKEHSKLEPPLPKTPVIFERYLAYALALNVEKAWSEKFLGVLAKTERPDRTAYSPGWYTGRGWSPATAVGFALSLGTSLASALASAAAPPSAHAAKPRQS